MADGQRGRLGELGGHGIFENIGVVQEGMESIAVPHSGVDQPARAQLEVPRGEIRFENLTFGYGRETRRRVLDDLISRSGPASASAS